MLCFKWKTIYQQESEVRDWIRSGVWILWLLDLSYYPILLVEYLKDSAEFLSIILSTTSIPSWITNRHRWPRSHCISPKVSLVLQTLNHRCYWLLALYCYIRIVYTCSPSTFILTQYMNNVIHFKWKLLFILLLKFKNNSSKLELNSQHTIIRNYKQEQLMLAPVLLTNHPLPPLESTTVLHEWSY